MKKPQLKSMPLIPRHPSDPTDVTDAELHAQGRPEDDMPPADVQVYMNMRCRVSTSESLAKRAQQDGVAMKTIVMRALQAYGVDVNVLDLEDNSPRSRRLRGSFGLGKV